VNSFRGWIERFDCFARRGLRSGYPATAFIARAFIGCKGFFGNLSFRRARAFGLYGSGFEVVIRLFSYVTKARRRSVAVVFACHL